MNETEILISLSTVLKWIDDNLHDERVLDDYRGVMVRGVQSSYTSIQELKDSITELAIKYNKEKEE